MSSLDQIVDHAAEMQQRVDQLGLEILILTVALAALAAGCMIMGWQLWHQS